MSIENDLSMFQSWPDIGSFEVMKVSNDKYFTPRKLPLPVVHYKAKPKMHGMNMAIRVNEDGKRFYQSREQNIDSVSDETGFVQFAVSLDFLARPLDYIVFGEWFGPGVKVKGREACRRIPSKCFGVFAIYCPQSDTLFSEPTTLSYLLPTHPQVHILPWVDNEYTVDLGSIVSCEAFATTVNQSMQSFETIDSWIKEIFGVEGPGEGLVFYPDSITLEEFRHRAFKAKTKGHSVKVLKEPVQVNVELVASAEAFATMFVTQARCEQALQGLTNPPTVRDTGLFLQWMTKDIQKESVYELEASDLSWKQVQTSVQTQAKVWFKNFLADT